MRIAILGLVRKTEIRTEETARKEDVFGWPIEEPLGENAPNLESQKEP